MSDAAARVHLRTPRTTIRPATLADAEATWAYRRLPQVYEWLTFAPVSLEQWSGLLAEPFRRERTLVVEHDGAVVGDLYLHLQDAWAQAEVLASAARTQAEIGWAIDPSYGGRGLATEAVDALVAFCFTDLGLRRVVAQCFADNEPSWRLMERIGMRRESHALAESLHRSAGWLDSYAYGLLAEEWRARHQPGGA
ncbi:GNAT family N-acetyltransferase [Nocardioides sp. zg-536]|uniref:GNAT family N-acetyltransferase n=1 Tax=Nocardioides faecalis TaxID=2803858 RepID=A0A939BTN1_9ACTN|nr:GNAT family protein [Nocardioides faecalis]MBM9460824.1 GNAT family N-acetyltransferase [Nocardioides faecalis]QVI58012.1 GNAT family N-acetyltransferase [Nocardioides faecalis]